MRPIAFSIAVILSLTPLVACKKQEAAAEAPAAPKADAQGRLRLSAQQAANIGIATASAQAADALPLTGLPAEAMAPLSSSTLVTVPYAGVVTKVLVDEGDSVTRGQPMLRVQSRELIGIQADLARARAEAGVAAQQAQRDALLAREGIISAARRQESAARAAAASVGVQEANAMMSQLRRSPGGLPGEFDILAPQSGRVLRREVTPGKAMEAMAPAFTIADGSTLDIQLAVPVALRDSVQAGLAVNLPDGAQARVVSVGADTDAITQTLRVRARAEDGASLVPGQQLQVSLQLRAPADAVVVPNAALLPDGDAFVLYVLEGDAYRGIRVQKLGSDDTQAIVQGKGLRAGLPVVKAGTSVLKTLAPVE